MSVLKNFFWSWGGGREGERGLKPFLKIKKTVVSKSQSNKNTQLRSAIIQIRPKNGQSQSLSS